MGKSFSGYSVLAVVAAVPCSAMAQDAPPSGDIVVTASKVGNDAAQEGRSVQLLEGADIRARGITHLADLARTVPGLTYTQASYGTPIYTIRGVGFYDSSLAAPPAVSLTIDEAPLPYPTLAGGAMLDLERVVVLKGPQGTLYGQNSTGGTINFVAAKPTDQLAFGAEESIARFGESDTEAFVSGPITATVGMRLAARYERAGAWQRSDTRDDSLGARDFLTARLLTRWTPSSRTTISLNLNGFRDRSDNQAGQLVGIYTTSPAVAASLANHPIGTRGNRVSDWGPRRTYGRHADYGQAVLRIDTRASFGTVTSISSAQNLRRDDKTDSDGTNLQLFEAGLPGRATILAQELRASGDLGASIHWILGGNYQREWIRDGLDARFADGNFPFDGTNVRTRQNVGTWALFANGDYALTPELVLEGGSRYTDEIRRFEGCSYDDGDGTGAAYVSRVASLLSGSTVTIAPGGCATLGADLRPAVVQDKLKDRNWSWRTGLKWRAADGLLIYANISRGHKSGAFITTGATSAGQFAPARPESVLAYEAGVKFSDEAQRFTVSAAGFYYDYDDKQLKGKAIDPRLGPLSGLINVPRSHVVGAEIDLSWQPIAGIVLTAAGSRTRSRIDGDFLNYDGLGHRTDLSGERFPLTPGWHLTGGADYRWEINEGWKPFFGAHVSYQSRTNAGLGNLPLLAMPGYALIDARAGVSWGRWAGEMFVQNLGGARYATFISAVSPDTVVRLAGRPRTLGLRLSYQL